MEYQLINGSNNSSVIQELIIPKGFETSVVNTTCADCKKNIGGGKFCQFCGYNNQNITCPNCKRDNAGIGLYCTHCQFKIDRSPLIPVIPGNPETSGTGTNNVN